MVTSMEKTNRLENEVTSLKSDISQIKEMLMAQMKATSSASPASPASAA